MAISLSNLVDNLSEGIHKIKCKDCDCFFFFKYELFKYNFIKYRCPSYNKDYLNKIDQKLTRRFKNTFKFSNNDINQFILLLREGVYPYECIDEWEKFIEKSLPWKEEFYGNLNIEDITDSDRGYYKSVCNDFES